MFSALDKALRSLQASVSVLRRGAVTDALFFDDAAYRAENEDVAQSVDAGRLRTSYDHYVQYGGQEGRKFALRRWGLSEPAASRLFERAANLEVQLDTVFSTLTYGELSHELRADDGSRIAKPIGERQPRSGGGPWRAPLPRTARQGGSFMLGVRVIPRQAPFAFRAIDGEGNPLGDSAALSCRMNRYTQRVLRIPPGATHLEIELLEPQRSTQPLRVRLRKIADGNLHTRLVRRIVHHHGAYTDHTPEQALARLTHEAQCLDRPLEDVLWNAYEGTFPATPPRYATWIDEVERPRLEALDRNLATVLDNLTSTPLISLLLPTSNVSEPELRACLASIESQSYPHWELCIVDDASPGTTTRRLLEEAGERDARMRVSFRRDRGHVCRASNDALAMANGAFVARLDTHDALARHALLEVAQAIDANPRAHAFYGDEDSFTVQGARDRPHFKCAFDPVLLLGRDYVGHLMFARTARVRAVGGFRPGYEGAHDHDLALRLTESLTPHEVVHIPRVLHHRPPERLITGAPPREREALAAGMAAVRDALRRGGVRGSVQHAAVPGCYLTTWPLPDLPPQVSMIVTTGNPVERLSACIEGLLQSTSYPRFEVLVVDDGSADAPTRALLGQLSRDTRVRVLRVDAPQNVSTLHNLAVADARGDVLAFLSHDLELSDPDWLGHLVALAARPDIGCVGAKVLCPNGAIRHAGVALGLGDLAGDPHELVGAKAAEHIDRLCVTHSVSAVRAACMVVKRAHHGWVGGFDEQLAVGFHDVDFCLRVRDAGFRNIFTPAAAVTLRQSPARAEDLTPERAARFQRDVAVVKRRWARLLREDPRPGDLSSRFGLGHDVRATQ